MGNDLLFLYAALCFLTVSQLCVGIDTLSANQRLSDGDVLICPSQMFEAGFFSPGTSSNRFLGVWYKATPDVVVWVANRQNPINASTGALTLSEDGRLLLTSAQSIVIWSSSSSGVGSSPVLQLRDTGNLVVVENSMNIWQSFDDPGDTRVPGMKMVDDVDDNGLDKYLTSWKRPDDPSLGDFVFRIENHGLSQVTTFMGNEKKFRTGPWNGIYFTGVQLYYLQDFKTDLVFDGGRVVSISFPYSSSVFLRMAMNYSGMVQTYVMNDARDGWILAASITSDTCDNYGWCGPNGICRASKQPLCECLRGFEPKSQSEWGVLSWTSGCTRKNQPSDCQKEEGFLEVERIKFPDTLNFRMDSNMSKGECRDECIRNCSCTAYAAPYLNNERNGCLMWFGDLIDVMELTGEVSVGPSIYIRVPASELGRSKRKGPAAKLVFIALAACFAILVLILSFACMILRMRCKKQAHDKKKMEEESELPSFSLETIAAATNSFSNENKIGEGGFGPVYKGNLSAERVVAVKRMSGTSGQGHQEFRNEVFLIARLQHRNLVRILGCCIEGEEKILIYEYLQNQSLDYFIFDENRSELLNWPKRFDIIMGIARGLLYLHRDSRLKIIHRDLKTSNILLDEHMNPKISDFGLARMLEGDQTAASTKRIVGTYGYMAPEYVFNGKFSVKSDVFSLGVIILEIVGGKKYRGLSHPYQNPLEQAWLLLKENRELELMDPCYNSSYVESQVKRCIQVGLLCVQNAANDRPMMPSVVLMLSSEDAVFAQPKKPGFFLDTSSSFSQRNEECRSCSLTITDVEGR